MDIQKIKITNVDHIQPIKVINAQTVVFNMKTQEKSVIPTKEEQSIKPDIEYDALSKVIVEPIPDEYIIPSGNLDIKTNGVHNVIEKASVNVDVQPSLQDKKVIVKPNENIDVISDEDFDGLRKVNVIGSVDTETVEATPTKEVQTINRSEDKYIESVKVNAIPDEYIIPSGELDITENGSYDVKDKESVNVEIASGGGVSAEEYFTETITGSSSSNTIGILQTIKKIPPLINTGTSCGYMFYGCTNLKEVDLSNFDTTITTDMNSLFYNCKSLTSLDLKSLNVSNVTTTYAMFRYCSSLTNINLSGWNTSSLNNMNYMFADCTLLTTLNIDTFNTSNVSSMNSLFYNCRSLTSLDLSHFNTQNTTDISSIFQYCENLTSVNVSNWNTSNVENMRYAFRGCKSLTSLDLSGWNTSNTTNMNDLFQNLNLLTYLDIRNFDFTKVTSYSNVFGSGTSVVPANCLIIVKDDVAKSWVLERRSDFTNVKTVAEYEAQ